MEPHYTDHTNQYGLTSPSPKPWRRQHNEDWKLRALSKLEVLGVKSIKTAMRSVTSSHFTIHVSKGASLQGEAEIKAWQKMG